MIEKRFGVDFHSEGGALTLPESAVSTDEFREGISSRLHESGWLISGVVKLDYYSWVNQFVAIHADHGVICGDFESVVYATSEQAFSDFMSKHEPEAWDYNDI